MGGRLQARDPTTATRRVSFVRTHGAKPRPRALAALRQLRSLQPGSIRVAATSRRRQLQKREMRPALRPRQRTETGEGKGGAVMATTLVKSPHSFVEPMRHHESVMARVRLDDVVMTVVKETLQVTVKAIRAASANGKLTVEAIVDRVRVRSAGNGTVPSACASAARSACPPASRSPARSTPRRAARQSSPVARRSATSPSGVLRRSLSRSTCRSPCTNLDPGR